MKKINIDTIFKEFDVECIYLYGNVNCINDIDLLIVSNSFKGISISKRKDLIKKNNNKIDPICLTIKDFEKLKMSESTLWLELIKNGILIYGLEKRYN
ncbi:MAG: hypothetical protein LUG18_06190 [Candidatus Azobacteroides sp.]|nr:hypothetical protein [Candidatus Azobacteroides sp.]